MALKVCIAAVVQGEAGCDMVDMLPELVERHWPSIDRKARNNGGEFHMVGRGWVFFGRVVDRENEVEVQILACLNNERRA